MVHPTGFLVHRQHSYSKAGSLYQASKKTYEKTVKEDKAKGAKDTSLAGTTHKYAPTMFGVCSSLNACGLLVGFATLLLATCSKLCLVAGWARTRQVRYIELTIQPTFNQQTPASLCVRRLTLIVCTVSAGVVCAGSGTVCWTSWLQAATSPCWMAA